MWDKTQQYTSAKEVHSGKAEFAAEPHVTV